MYFHFFLYTVLMVVSSVGAATDCGKLANTSMYTGTITSPLSTVNKTCLWNIMLLPKYKALQIHFHNFTLKNCNTAPHSCDYIEIWSSQTRDPLYLAGRFTGDVKNDDIFVKGPNVLVEYGSTSLSGMKSNHTFLSYKGYEVPNQRSNGCGKVNNITMDRGNITGPFDKRWKKCLWYIEVSSKNTGIHLRFYDLTLRKCPNCSCEYIEVWGSPSKDPKHWIGKFCGDLKSNLIEIEGNEALVEFGSNSLSGMKSNHTFLSYEGYQIITCYFPYFENYIHSSDRPSFVVTAIGIICAIIAFVGVLGCGVHITKLTRRRRRVRRRTTTTPFDQPSRLQPDADVLTLPKLPNYFETEKNSVLPPYLGFLDEVNNIDSVSPPPYDDPPPYSLTEAPEMAGLDAMTENITAAQSNAAEANEP